jgi:phage/plasmid-like protein (TIGR03299 family)
MAHMVETMAYSGEVPWHGLGVSVDPDLTPQEMLVTAGLDWQVNKKPLYTAQADGSYLAVPGRFAIERDTDASVLALCSADYNPVQNAEAMEFFSRFTKAGHATMETAGSLAGGKYIWGLARIAADFKLGRSDDVLAYLLLMQPHVPGHALTAQTTATRVVCWNTLNIALGKGLRGGANAFRMNHLQKFDAAMQKRAEEALGMSIEQIGEFKAAAQVLSKAKIANDNELIEYFDNVISFDRAKAEAEGREEPRVIGKLQQAFESGPGAKMGTAKGTYWGAVNAVTYIVDHQTGRSRDTALKSAWVAGGSGALLKQRALSVALEKIAA